MEYFSFLVTVVCMIIPVFGTDIGVENFASPTHTWKSKNDPVMGGESKGSVSIVDGIGIFDGEVVDVPFLHAPGFITMETKGGLYPDLSTCQGLKLTLRASEPYAGYRISFGKVHVPGGRYAFGYKANFSPPVGQEFYDIEIPFHEFSARWDDATGDAIVTCEEEAKFCPTLASLQDLQTLSIWGEGVAGKVHLEIKYIGGSKCAEVDVASDDNIIMNHWRVIGGLIGTFFTFFAAHTVKMELPSKAKNAYKQVDESSTIEG